MRSLSLLIALGGMGALCGQGPTLAEAHTVLPLAEGGSRAALAGDVNGDGFADIVFVGNGEDAVWFGTADGGFVRDSAAFSPPTQPDGFNPSFTLADLDGDGDLDACVLDWALSFGGGMGSPPMVFGGGVRIYANDGTGAFHQVQLLGAQGLTGELTSSIAAGDVDGDQDVDLLVGVRPLVWGYQPPLAWYTIWSASGGQNRLFLNTGNGTFVDATNQLPMHSDYTMSVVLADVDGDGDLDAFCGNSPHSAGGAFGLGQDRLYRNVGGGSFVDVPILADTASNGGAFARDFDGDGDVDLLLFDRPQLRYLTNSGSGVFTASTPAVAATVNSQQLFVGDWDHDGWIDYALRDTSTWIPARNVGGVFVAQPAANLDLANFQDRAIVVADYERDGDLDVIAPGNLVYPTQLWRRSGVSWQSAPNDAPLAPLNRARLGDIDGDGSLDLVSTNGSPGSCRVWRNAGGGRFEFAANGQFPANSETVLSLALADLDGDGDVDVVTAGSTAGATRAFFNAAGILSAGPTLLPAAKSVAIGDLDGDGDLDLYFGHWADSSILLNQGQGQFVANAMALPPGTSTASVMLADLDGDGDLDVLSVDPSLVVLRNSGNGTFGAWNGTGIASSPGPMVAGDFDGDGDVDVILGATLWRNDGSGAFAAQATGIPPASGAIAGESLAAADFDGDGDLDLLRSPRTVANVREPAALFVNDGTGAFSLQPGGIVDGGRWATDLAIGDLDGDGDQDAALVTPTAPIVIWNRQHQLTWGTLPRVGHGLRLDLEGRANEPWALALAAAPANLPLPGLGLLRVDPATMLLVAVGAYDGAGLASWQIPVPLQPSLVGVSGYWQALSGNASPRLGNLEVTVLLAP